MRSPTRDEVQVAERLASGPIEQISPADIQQIFGRESNSFLANSFALKFPDRCNELRRRAVQLGLVAPAAPRNRQEMIERQGPPSESAPPPEAPTREAETLKGEITWEEMQKRARQQMANFSMEQRLKREEERQQQKQVA